MIENNVIELGVRQSPGGYGPATAFPMYGYSLFPPEFSLRDIIIRGNVVRNVDDAFFPSSFALDVYYAERVLIENNIINLDNPTPLWNRFMGTIKTFNNTTPGGTLIPAVDPNRGNAAAPELITQVKADLDDANLAAFLDL